MNLARVIGTIWGTRKHESLDGASMRLIQPLTGELRPFGRPLAAADTVGAGPGEIVFYVTAYEAAIPWLFRRGATETPVAIGGTAVAPLDASIVGIVERVDRGDGFRP